MTDPAAETFRSARREARFVLAVWFAALCWTVGYSYLHGYPHDPDGWIVRGGLAPAEGPAGGDLTLGVPSWVFWGVAVPAAVCAAVTFAYGLWCMRDDPLGAEGGEPKR